MLSLATYLSKAINYKAVLSKLRILFVKSILIYYAHIFNLHCGHNCAKKICEIFNM